MGGWSSKGVDPAIYSRNLMNFAKEATQKLMSDPLDILSYAFNKCKVIY